MLGRFGVEGDIGGAGFDKVADDAIDRADHQMRIDRCGDAVLAQGGADHRADGQVGYVMVVHDIEVNDISTRGEYVVHFFAETGEIGGKNRWGNSEGLHDVYRWLCAAHRSSDDWPFVAAAEGTRLRSVAQRP